MQAPIIFEKPSEFSKILRSRVEWYFRDNHRAHTADWRVYLKIVIALSLMITSYISLVFIDLSLWQALVALVIFTQWSVILMFNAMHDGGHSAFSKKSWISTLMVSTLDLVGGSSYLWKIQHNINHHSYTNIDEKDTDIDSYGILRLSPEQSWRWWHKYQFLFAPMVYACITLSWLFSDIQRMFEGEIRGTRFPKRTLSIWIYFFSTKIIYFLVILGIPMLYHDAWIVFGFFIAYHLMFWLTMTTVFSLAHITGGNEFPKPTLEWNMEYEHMEHTLRTTTDFAPENSFAGWYLGGLNYQVVHHLFPHVSHVHYREIRKIVESTCREYNMPYHCIPTFLGAVRSHFRHLRNMGRWPKNSAIKKWKILAT